MEARSFIYVKWLLDEVQEAAIWDLHQLKDSIFSTVYRSFNAQRRKTNTFSLVASFDLEVSPSCVRLSNDPSTKKKKNQHSFWASTRPYIGWRSHVWRACLVHAGRRLVWDLAGRPSGRAS